MTDTLPPLTGAQVREIRAQIEEARNLLRDKIYELKLRCVHENMIYKHNGSGGSYYDPPSYWVEYTCLDCDKLWHFSDGDRKEEQQKIREMREKYPRARDATRDK